MLNSDKIYRLKHILLFCFRSSQMNRDEVKLIQKVFGSNFGLPNEIFDPYITHGIDGYENENDHGENNFVHTGVNTSDLNQTHLTPNNSKVNRKNQNFVNLNLSNPVYDNYTTNRFLADIVNTEDNINDETNFVRKQEVQKYTDNITKFFHEKAASYHMHV